MEFTSNGRGNMNPQPIFDNEAPQSAPRPPQHHHPLHQPPARRKHIDWATRTVRIELFILLLGCSLILIAISLFLGFNSSSTAEADRVDGSKFQAVFLNGGVTSGNINYSTYFGRIASINDKYIVLQNVYYLVTNTTSNKNQSTDSQLAKLGCEQLHSPYDEMVINRDQVAFWENIQDSGKVAKAIAQYIKQNPNGPNCSDGSSPTKQNTTTTPAPTTTDTTTNTNQTAP